MAIDVSVIVPVYNTERYLTECIESLINQTLRSIELIFVDDGSTDRSVELLEKYQKQDKRIKIIKQQNQYAGVARNNGMKIASGKYIIFLDSDDFFELNMLEKVFNYAEKNQAEITVFWYSVYDDKEHSIRRLPYPEFPHNVLTLEEIGEEFSRIYQGTPWNKLFLRSFIIQNELMFQRVKKCNDTYFVHMAAYLAQRIVFLKKRFVFYRINNSASLQGNPNRDRDSFLSYQLAIRAKLNELDLFYGMRRKAYYNDVKRIIHYYGSIVDANIESLRLFFQRTKAALIPGLFDSVEDFSDDPLIMCIFHGGFEDFLLYQANTLSHKKQNRKEYVIGHTLLIIPRMIKRILKYMLKCLS